MKVVSDFIIRPVISEKSFAEAKIGKYTFVVDSSANKTDIRRAVESVFGVNVRKVSTVNIKGTKTRNTKVARYKLDASYKKARVMLAKGEKINIFEEDTKENEKKEKKK